MRRTAVALAVGLAALAAGCGSGGSGTGSGSPSSITVWTYYNTPGQLAFENEAATLFNQKFPKVKVDYVNVPFNNLDSKLLAAASVHTGPDVVIDDPIVDFPELANAGALADMSPYLGQITSEFPSDALWRSGGKIETVQSYVNIIALWYNKSILDKLNLPVPATNAQLAQDLSVVTKHGYTGMLMDGDTAVEGAWQLFPWLSSRGLTWCSLRSASTIPTVTAALQQLRSWEQNGWIPKSFDTFTQTNTVPMFLAGKTAFMVNGNWNIATAQKSASFQFGITRLPADTSPGRPLIGGEGEAIGGYSPNKTMAANYLRYGWFNATAGKALLKDTGSLVTEKDLASYVHSAPYEGAYLTEVNAGLGTWPNNKEVDKMTTDVGDVWSGYAGGNGTAQSTAESIRSTIISDLAEGGGSC